MYESARLRLYVRVSECVLLSCYVSLCMCGRLCVCVSVRKYVCVCVRECVAVSEPAS